MTTCLPSAKVLLRDPALVEVAPRNTTAAEVEQRVYAVDSDRKVALVEHMLTVKGWAPALIFSRTRQGRQAGPAAWQGASMRSPSTGICHRARGKTCCWRFAQAPCRPWWPPTWRLAASISASSTM